MEIKPYERQAHYYETDQMGIVHHSNYFRYFEEARMDFMRQIGCGALEMERMGVIIPNVDAYAKYLRLLRCEDRFVVKVTLALFTGVRMKYEYEVARDGEVCCTGHTTHCFVNQAMRPVNLKHVLPEAFARLAEAAVATE